jgi:XTP/dITP diphosphohydrolase
MRIVLSTRNPSKIEQIKAIFTGTPISIMSLAEAGIEGEGVEDGTSLVENAMKKALFAHRPGEWSMADDTGIYIHALEGRPGIHSARWAGDTATTDEITTFTLKQMEGVRDRSASFRTTVALISPDGVRRVFSATVWGELLEAPRVSAQPMMPYNPLFIPQGSKKVLAEMSVDEENAVSHRGKAFRLAREYLLGLGR